MNPRATLKAAHNAIDDDDQGTATESLEAYAEWRASGGFEPFIVHEIGGDFTWRYAVEKYEKKWGEYGGRRLG